mmetsp:Transcript_32243/g.69496  ORF Transcript_32243/g.69496 Transcript_32243/m.69496 type:complete len:216 (-) Transcript_32243:890-1537(-)
MRIDIRGMARQVKTLHKKLFSLQYQNKKQFSSPSLATPGTRGVGRRGSPRSVLGETFLLSCACLQHQSLDFASLLSFCCLPARVCLSDESGLWHLNVANSCLGSFLYHDMKLHRVCWTSLLHFLLVRRDAGLVESVDESPVCRGQIRIRWFGSKLGRLQRLLHHELKLPLQVVFFFLRRFEVIEVLLDGDDFVLTFFGLAVLRVAVLVITAGDRA